MDAYDNPWTFKDTTFNSEDILDHQGFVYCITSLATGRMYIGKKNFISPKTNYKTDKITKKRKKIRSKVESDWKSYHGSNKELGEDVLAQGSDKFKREILYLCKTKAEMGYLELREQMDRRVLESPEYYNAWIMVRIRKDHLKNL